MSLIRWKPAEVQSRFKNEFDRLFDSFFDNFEFGRSNELFPVSPKADIEETDNNYVVNLDLPGIDKKDLKIHLENGNLIIKGEKKQQKDYKDSNMICSERSYGSFQRVFSLPSEVKSGEIDAEYKDGVLKISLPKAEEVKRKEIQIKVK